MMSFISAQVAEKKKGALYGVFYDEMKNNPKYSAISAKHAYGKV